jgi:uncharacterized protein (DUF1778 family)
MKSKVIHCRVTDDQHKTILDAAAKAGLSVTQFVLRAVLEAPAKAAN